MIVFYVVVFFPRPLVFLYVMCGSQGESTYECVRKYPMIFTPFAVQIYGCVYSYVMKGFCLCVHSSVEEGNWILYLVA